MKLGSFKNVIKKMFDSGLVLWHINIVGYLIPNPLYTYILNIFDLVWRGFMAYQLL